MDRPSSATEARLRTALADRYRIEREIGQGGMATVYLAHDLRHERDVAIKVLRNELAAVVGPDRFLSEIRTTAGLQHPNILPLHDSGLVDGILFYVMPYVEGESLRSRLEREGQLPIDDALRLAGEIAGALDYAHRKGIIHRDIKPENILLHDGRAVVADFGIALAASRAGGTRLTETGLSLGTPSYMSPEQAMGERQITARSDIFALGAVTYEMLAGDPPFTGASSQAVVARVLTGAPPSLRATRPSVPPVVESAILKALERVPADRWKSAADFAAALERRGDMSPSPVPGHDQSREASRRVAVILAGIALFTLLVAAAVWGARRLSLSPPSGGTARLVLPLEPGLALTGDPLPFAVSADGSTIVYSAESGGRTQLFLRPLANFEARAIPGTDGARHPFFSPDGEWIGFLADGKLQKVRRDGGAPIPIASFTGIWGGAEWGRDRTILYAAGGPTLYRISEQGGPATAIRVSFDPATSSRIIDQAPVRWPSRLPDGEHVLVTADTTVAVLTLATGELRPLFRGRQARYLQTGHLLYDEDEGHIRVVPFDLAQLAVTASPRPAFEVFRSPGNSTSHFAVSESGTVVYVAGGIERSLVLTDSAGRETALPVPARGYRFPRFSPDGSRLAVTVDPRPSQIWMLDLRRASAVPIVTGAHNILAEWSPDGGRLAFFRAGLTHWITWPGGSPPTPALAREVRENLFLSDWAAGDVLVGVRNDTAGRNIVRFKIGDSAATPLSFIARNAWSGHVSPDGRWIAYVSDASGLAEVYVRAFDGSGEAMLVSAGGGADPRWTADGGLVYRNGTSIMRVDVRLASTFETIGPPRELFSRAYDFLQERNWDISSAGRFVFVRSDPRTVGRLMVVLNWFAELD